MPPHAELYELAVRAINDLASDRSVDHETLRLKLLDLHGEIDSRAQQLERENDSNAEKVKRAGKAAGVRDERQQGTGGRSTRDISRSRQAIRGAKKGSGATKAKGAKAGRRQQK